MAVTNYTGLQISNPQVGIQITKVTDSSADWGSLANSTYFYDKATALVYFKDGTGSVLSLFSAAGGLTEFTEAENTSAPNATVPVNSLTPVTATTNADFAIVPKGTGAILADIPDNTATGGNKRGQYSVDLQMDRSNANQVASGNWSFIVGRNNRASGDYSNALGVNNIATGSLGTMSNGYNSSATNLYSYALGYANTASGAASLAIGYGNTASGNNSAAFGASSVASADQSIAMGNTSVANGLNSTAMGYYSHVFGLKGRWVTGQVNTVAGDAQKSIFCLSIRTTDATATTLTSGFGSGSPSSSNQVILSNQSGYRFKGSLIGKQSGSTNISSWDIDGLIVRGANAAATTLVVSNVNLVSNTPAWGTPTLAADTTNGGLQIQVIGAVGTNIQWTAIVETTEVIYA